MILNHYTILLLFLILIPFASSFESSSIVTASSSLVAATLSLFSTTDYVYKNKTFEDPGSYNHVTNDQSIQMVLIIVIICMAVLCLLFLIGLVLLVARTIIEARSKKKDKAEKSEFLDEEFVIENDDV
mmetsp:Transcript_8513/g.12553  ORF Transcript_8513/g.12553 Transcript_8513/m.12553 type:complete len:128 (+) Transcript_8513:124-507(+)